MKPHGWYRDPFGVHEDRNFSDGNRAKLVRDGAAEAYDEPPPGPLPGLLVKIPPSGPEGSSRLRRGDDCESSPGVAGRRKPVMPVIEDPAAFYGPLD
jgi:hypothetical protein